MVSVLKHNKTKNIYSSIYLSTHKEFMIIFIHNLQKQQTFLWSCFFLWSISYPRRSVLYTTFSNKMIYEKIFISSIYFQIFFYNIIILSSWLQLMVNKIKLWLTFFDFLRNHYTNLKWARGGVKINDLSFSFHKSRLRTSLTLFTTINLQLKHSTNTFAFLLIVFSPLNFIMNSEFGK